HLMEGTAGVGMVHNVQVVTTVSTLALSSGISSAEPSIKSTGKLRRSVSRAMPNSLGEGSSPITCCTLGGSALSRSRFPALGRWPLVPPDRDRQRDVCSAWTNRSAAERLDADKSPWRSAHSATQPPWLFNASIRALMHRIAGNLHPLITP